MKNNPNAAVGTVAGGGGGALVLWVLSLFHVTVDPYIAATLAGVVAGFVLFVGRNGLVGLAHLIWRGSGG